MKCRNTIINEMVDNSAEVMSAKANEMILVAEQFEKKGDSRYIKLRVDAERIRQAVNLIQEYSGCWS